MDVSRRGFIAGASAASVCGAGAQHVSQLPAERVTFLAFADIHYFPGVFPHDSREWLERILATAKESGLAVIGFDELPAAW